MHEHNNLLGYLNLKAKPTPGEILTDFPVQSLPLHERWTVSERYKAGDYAPELASYCAVGLNLLTGEVVLAPGHYRTFRVAQRPTEITRPTGDRLNSPAVQQLLTGKTP